MNNTEFSIKVGELLFNKKINRQLSIRTNFLKSYNKVNYDFYRMFVNGVLVFKDAFIENITRFSTEQDQDIKEFEDCLKVLELLDKTKKLNTQEAIELLAKMKEASTEENSTEGSSSNESPIEADPVVLLQAKTLERINILSTKLSEKIDSKDKPFLKDWTALNFVGRISPIKTIGSILDLLCLAVNTILDMRESSNAKALEAISVLNARPSVDGDLRLVHQTIRSGQNHMDWSAVNTPNKAKLFEEMKKVREEAANSPWFYDEVMEKFYHFSWLSWLLPSPKKLAQDYVNADLELIQKEINTLTGTTKNKNTPTSTIENKSTYASTTKDKSVLPPPDSEVEDSSPSSQEEEDDTPSGGPESASSY